MSDQGIRLTDTRTKQLMRRLESTYTEAYKKAVENNKSAIAKYASLTDEALKDLSEEAKYLKREAFKREIIRTKTLQESIAKEMASAGKTAAQIVQGEMIGIYGLNFDFTAFNVQRQTGIDLNFALYDRNQLAAIVQEGQSPFTKIAYRNMGNDAVIVRRLQNELIQGVMLGESQQKIMRRIRGVTGQSVNQAKRVAQTERVRVQSQARNQAIQEAQEMGIEMQKQWIARLQNTRESHLDSHLEIVDEGETFVNGLEYPGDPSGSAAEVINCHCVLKPRVKSVSRALARHRAKFQDENFAEYERKREVLRNKVEGDKVDTNMSQSSRNKEEKRLKDILGATAVDTKGLSAGVISNINTELDSILKEHPQLHGVVQQINTTNDKYAGTASFNVGYRNGIVDTSLTLNAKELADIQGITDMIADNVSSGYWTAKDGVGGIIRHEMAHALEFKQTFVEHGIDFVGASASDALGRKTAVLAYGRHEVADRTVHQALENLGLGGNEWVSLSGYAAVSKAEAFAEALSDTSDQALSKEIKRITKGGFK